MSVTVADVKKYLRIDYDEEDDLLESFLSGAQSYLVDAVTDFEKHYADDEKFAAKADVVTAVLVAEMFTNRDGRNDQRRDYSFVTRSMINQLQYFSVGDTS